MRHIKYASLIVIAASCSPARSQGEPDVSGTCWTFESYFSEKQSADVRSDVVAEALHVRLDPRPAGGIEGNSYDGARSLTVGAGQPVPFVYWLLVGDELQMGRIGGTTYTFRAPVPSWDSLPDRIVGQIFVGSDYGESGSPNLEAEAAIRRIACDRVAWRDGSR